MTTTPPEPTRWTAGPDDDGRRVDIVVSQTLELSRSMAQRLLKNGHATVDGERVAPRHRVAAGEVLEVRVPEPEPTSIVPESMDLDILFDDSDIVVLNKPVGLVVHPGAGNRTGTLVNGLVHRFPEMDGVGGEGRPGLVQRLDKDTSGVMVVAKTDAAYHRLVEAMQAREIRREYVAVVWGSPPESGEIDAPIGRHPRHRTEMAVRPDGRDAVTRYRVRRRFDFVSVVDLALLTGRTHQIRVHMAHIGHPVFGDPVYGNRMRRVSVLSGIDRRRVRRWHGCISSRGVPRQALHAAIVEFDHPRTGERMRHEAPPPSDFDALVRALESD